MKNLPAVIISVLMFGIVLSGNVSAAKYSAEIDVFSNYIPLDRQPFTFFVDFGREISLKSLKMKPAEKNEQDTNIPVYAVPLSKYRALIHFMPHKNMDPDSELNYILTFEDGKWDGKATGDAALKKSIESAPNLIPNNSFEKVHKARDRFLNWTGKTDAADWRLQDYAYQFVSIDNPESTCRVSSDEAVEGLHSLCFKSGKPRQMEVKGAIRNFLISGSANSLKAIVLKPNTVYKLSFFLKVAKWIDNGMNLQGAAVYLNMQDSQKQNLSGGVISALYSTNTKPQNTYLNKWIYVQGCEITPKDAAFGRINIAEKVSGMVYIDMLELREIKNNALPEIIVREIKIEK